VELDTDFALAEASFQEENMVGVHIQAGRLADNEALVMEPQSGVGSLLLMMDFVRNQIRTHGTFLLLVDSIDRVDWAYYKR